MVFCLKVILKVEKINEFRKGGIRENLKCNIWKLLKREQEADLNHMK